MGVDERARRAGLSGILLVVLSGAAGCGWSRPEAGPPPTAPAAVSAAPAPSPTPHWDGERLPGPIAGVLAGQLRSRWGFEVHSAVLTPPPSAPGGPPRHVEYEGRTARPGGYELAFMITAEPEGRSRFVQFTVAGAMSAAAANDLADAVDLALDGRLPAPERASLIARFTGAPEQAPARPAVVDGTEIRLDVTGREPGVYLVRPLSAGTP
ncbi:hypothetical protein [Kitasatospora sp. NPDC056184]|uniref:hypothetical protein n=1 Tax=Kitasatospora sp. NPDC056184 TaxID=3345738 RepID=UPI0035DED6FD